jgi:hypothetical protein
MKLQIYTYIYCANVSELSRKTVIIAQREPLEIIWLEVCAPVGSNATVHNCGRQRTYGNNTQRGFSKEQERRGGERRRGDYRASRGLRIKTQVQKPKKYTPGRLRD